MNLNPNQLIVQDGRVSQNVERFCAFGGLKTPHCVSGLRCHNRPEANIHTRISVCVLLVAALFAMEAQAMPVGRRDVAAGRTAPACVSRVNLLDRNADVLRLVGDLELPLSERPSVDLCPVVFPSPERTVSYVRQVFKDYPPCAIIDRVFDQCLGGDMQEMSCYGSLVVAHSLEESAGRTGANGLDLCAGVADASAAVIQFTALEEKCTAVSRVGRDHKSFDAEVHADDAAFGLRLRHVNQVRQYQIPHLADALELGLAPAGDRNCVMGQRDHLAEDSDAVLLGAHQVIAWGDWHGRLLIDAKSPSFKCFGGLVGGCDLPEYVTRQLGRDFELAPDSGVECTVELVGVEFLGLENALRYPVRSLQIADSDCVKLGGFANFNLNCSDDFQYNHNMLDVQKSQIKSR